MLQVHNGGAEVVKMLDDRDSLWLPAGDCFLKGIHFVAASKSLPSIIL